MKSMRVDSVGHDCPAMRETRDPIRLRVGVSVDMGST